MENLENRHIARDSLFVLADLRLDGEDFDHRVKMRNLSAGGMMAEGQVKVMRGSLVWVHLRNIGWTGGTVAWIQENRFGIAFHDEIDPRLARAPATAAPQAETFVPFKPMTLVAPRPEGPKRKI